MLLFFTQMLNIVNQCRSASGVHGSYEKSFENRKNLGVLNTSERTQRGKKISKQKQNAASRCFYPGSDAVSLCKAEGCKRCAFNRIAAEVRRAVASENL